MKMTAEALPCAPEDLCVVRHIPEGVVKKGTIMARDGCWQLKVIVEYVTYIGQQPTPYTAEPMHTWLIGVRNLGEFYADGRYYLAANSKVKEHIFRSHQFVVESSFRPHLFGYVPVTPVGVVKGVKGVPIKKIFPPKPKKIKDPLKALNAKLLPKPKLTPEEQLAKFLIH